MRESGVSAPYIESRSLAHGYAALGADSPRRAFRNNNADPTNSMKNTAFPPNPRDTGAVQEVTGRFRLSTIARTNAWTSAVTNKARAMPFGWKRAAAALRIPTSGTTR